VTHVTFRSKFPDLPSGDLLHSHHGDPFEWDGALQHHDEVFFFARP
jgi:hypothetical protein